MSLQYAVQYLVPDWATNPEFIPGEPLGPPSEPHFLTLEQAEAYAQSARLTAYRIVVRDVSEWREVW